MKTGYNKYNLEASFKNYLLAENISRLSVKNYMSDLRFFLGWLHNYSKNLPIIDDLSGVNEDVRNIDTLNQVTFENVEKFKNYLKGSNVPRQSINRRISTIRKFGEFCVKQGWLRVNPAKDVKSVSINPLKEDKEYLISKTIETYFAHLSTQKLSSDEIVYHKTTVNALFNRNNK